MSYELEKKKALTACERNKLKYGQNNEDKHEVHQREYCTLNNIISYTDMSAIKGKDWLLDKLDLCALILGVVLKQDMCF